MPKGDNNRKLTDEHCAEIVRLYTTQNSDGTWSGGRSIARQFSVTQTAIYNVLRRYGVILRNAKEAHSGGKRCKPVKNLPVGNAPTCKCGCGTAVAWDQRRNRWRPYVRGHYHPTNKHRDSAWLREQYVDKRRTAQSIAAEVGIAENNVLFWMRRHGIPRRNGSEAHEGTNVGANNPAWKGGTTPDRQRLYKKGEWKSLVSAVLARDNFTCRCCGVYRATNVPKLVTHHLQPFATHPELRFDPDNLVTLCEKCHRWVHSRANTDRRFLP